MQVTREPVSLFGLRAGVETDRDGRFAVDTVPRGEEYALSVETARHPVFRVLDAPPAP